MAASMCAEIPPEEVGYIPDKVLKAERRTAGSPYDTEAWSVLIRDAQNKKIDDARQLYERLVVQFPSVGKYWKIYIEHEMKANNYEHVESLFHRCLIKVLNIDLWKTYLNYIKETKGSLPSFNEKMAQAYEFGLDKIGMDIMSYPIWCDYIQFLKSVNAVGSYAENRRITAVRKVYQRGIVNPMLNIEIFWNDYGLFENAINPLIARKMQDDKSRDYYNMPSELARNMRWLLKGSIGIDHLYLLTTLQANSSRWSCGRNTFPGRRAIHCELRSRHLLQRELCLHMSNVSCAWDTILTSG